MTAAAPAGVHPLTMPKWGMAMDEGRVTAWLAAPGQQVEAGQEVVEIESAKASGAVEAGAAGVLHAVAEPGSVLPVGGLLALIAAPEVPEAELAAFIAAHAEADRPGAEEDAPRPRLVESDGQAINLLEAGDGDETIVLLHGFGGDLAGWGLVQSELARRHRTLALDLPGHGGSGPAIGGTTPEGFAGTVAEVVRDLGVERFHLVGHSLGGAVAIACAGAHPQRVASLTLLAPAGLGEEIEAAFLHGFLAARRRKDLRPVFERLFADPALVTREMLETAIRAKRMDGASETLERLAACFFPEGRQAPLGLRDTLESLAMPWRVIWGRDDRIVPVSQAEGLAAVSILDGVGHMPQIERPSEVVRLVEETLARGAARRTSGR